MRLDLKTLRPHSKAWPLALRITNSHASITSPWFRLKTAAFMFGGLRLPAPAPQGGSSHDAAGATAQGLLEDLVQGGVFRANLTTWDSLGSCSWLSTVYYVAREMGLVSLQKARNLA